MTPHPPNHPPVWRVLGFVLAFALPIFTLSSYAGKVAPVDAKTEDPAAKVQRLILEGAQREANRHTPYIMEYQVLTYPAGDVPVRTGVCTDLVIRAFRNAGLDIQQMLHEDRKAHPEAYPTQIWENKRPDKNIDHRRCQNLIVWFRRHTRALTPQTDLAHLGQWQPGDVVFYVKPGASYPWHVAIISDAHDADGMPLIIDSYPPATSQSHRLDEWGPIHSHFRWENSPRPQSEKR